MRTLGLSSSTIKIIVDDPSALVSPLKFGLAPSTATYILDHGYTKGFRILFILHACLAALATLTSITMIKHKTLTGGEEGQQISGAVQGDGPVDTRESLHTLPVIGGDKSKSGVVDSIEMDGIGGDGDDNKQE